MIGLPTDQTRAEKSLRIIGLLGALLGCAFIGLAVLFFFLGFVQEFSVFAPADSYTLFFLGASGVVAGVILAAFGQALATFRLMAHNTHKKER